MSITSWYLILSRSLRQLRARSHSGAVEAFWAAPDLDAGLRVLAGRPGVALRGACQQGAAAANVRRHTRQHPRRQSSTPTRSSAPLRKSIALSTAARSSPASPCSPRSARPPLRRPLRHGVGHLPRALVNISVRTAWRRWTRWQARSARGADHDRRAASSSPSRRCWPITPSRANRVSSPNSTPLPRPARLVLHRRTHRCSAWRCAHAQPKSPGHAGQRAHGAVMAFGDSAKARRVPAERHQHGAADRRRRWCC